MKKIKFRAGALLIMAGAIAAGLALFVFRLAASGGDWIMFRGNGGLYTDGVLNTVALYDRNGVTLARADGESLQYSRDSAIRAACLHAVGDFEGNIGTGALSAFGRELSGYNFIFGTSSLSGAQPELRLTIDAELCAAAYAALGGRRGAVLLMDYTTGEILAMVSSPSFDPAAVPDLDAPQYEGAYINRAISAAYTPGSVFKIVTLAAALENISGLDSRVFQCSGSVTRGGEVINCTGVHGSQTLADAFGNSCNCAFAELSLELGSGILAQYAEKYGLTETHSLDGIATAEGSFSPAADGSAELAWSGIGQHEDLACPFSVLRLVAAVAGGGSLAQPRLLAGGGFFTGSSETVMNAATAQTLQAMMRKNVSDFYGSWIFSGLEAGAKTGTAEVGDGTSHAWIAGFVSDPELPLAFTVIVENAGSGLAAAAPVADAVLRAASARNFSGNG